MRLVGTFMKKEYEEACPDSAEVRELILSKIPIPKITDPIQVLHDSIHASDCTPVADGGREYESLFNKFAPADYRNWRTRAKGGADHQLPVRFESR